MLRDKSGSLEVKSFIPDNLIPKLNFFNYLQAR